MFGTSLYSSFLKDRLGEFGELENGENEIQINTNGEYLAEVFINIEIRFFKKFLLKQKDSSFRGVPCKFN